MKQQHTITKFGLTLYVPAGGYASVARENIARICNEKLLPELDRLFNSWAGPDEYIVLDKLEIVVKAKSVRELELSFVDQVIKKINAQFDPSVSFSAPGIVFSKKNKEQHLFERWLYFLRHGQLPGGASIENESQWEQDVLEVLATRSDVKQKCRDLLNEYPDAIERLLVQYHYEFLKKWIAAFGGYTSMGLYELTRQWMQLVTDPCIAQLVRQVNPGFEIPPRFVHNSWYCLVKAIINGPETKTSHDHIEALLKICFSDQYRRLIVSVINNIELQTMHVSQQARPAFDALKPVFIVLPEIYNDDKLLTNKNDNFRKEKDVPGNALPKEKPLSKQISSNTKKNPSDEMIVESSDSAIKKISGNVNRYQPEKIFPDKPATNKDEHVSLSKPNYINNSGLVILHPYLPSFFDYLHLLHEQKFKDPPARDKAVQLLSWLAHGETGLTEHQLLLLKILCGIPPEQTVDRFIELTETEKEEGELLLKAVVENWKAIGNTSPDGLRANFILREGKLEWLNNEWRLRVTQATPDILLEKLPWSISVIRLPWMSNYLKTEWV